MSSFRKCSKMSMMNAGWTKEARMPRRRRIIRQVRSSAAQMMIRALMKAHVRNNIRLELNNILIMQLEEKFPKMSPPILRIKSNLAICVLNIHPYSEFLLSGVRNFGKSLIKKIISSIVRRTYECSRKMVM